MVGVMTGSLAKKVVILFHASIMFGEGIEVIGQKNNEL
jgi:hypothetical protein